MTTWTLMLFIQLHVPNLSTDKTFSLHRDYLNNLCYEYWGSISFKFEVGAINILSLQDFIHTCICLTLKYPLYWETPISSDATNLVVLRLDFPIRC